MNVVCLDLEGVLVPEIWIEFANACDIPELTRTTREEPDYDKLMQYRLDILDEHGCQVSQTRTPSRRSSPSRVRALSSTSSGRSRRS